MLLTMPLLLQYRHYKACLDIFNLHPSKDSREFADLIGFVAQVRPHRMRVQHDCHRSALLCDKVHTLHRGLQQSNIISSLRALLVHLAA